MQALCCPTIYTAHVIYLTSILSTASLQLSLKLMACWRIAWYSVEQLSGEACIVDTATAVVTRILRYMYIVNATCIICDMH